MVPHTSCSSPVSSSTASITATSGRPVGRGSPPGPPCRDGRDPAGLGSVRTRHREAWDAGDRSPFHAGTGEVMNGSRPRLNGLRAERRCGRQLLSSRQHPVQRLPESIAGARSGSRAALVGAPAHVSDVRHIGCCDDKPSKHASAHFRNTRHPIMRSAEPGETGATATSTTLPSFSTDDM
jgi:hypothetical protein